MQTGLSTSVTVLEQEGTDPLLAQSLLVVRARQRTWPEALA